MFLKTLNFLLAEWIKIPSEGLSPLLERKLHERLVFTNPDYEMRHNRGEWIGNIPPQISCLRQKGRNYLLPRGFLDQFLELCRKFQQPYRIVDMRRMVDPVEMEFHGELKSYQQDAAEAVLEKDFSTLLGGHKSGKTVIALYTIAQRRQPTLILIPKLDLLEGWLTKIENFLQIPASEVGIFSGGVHQVGKQITIGHTGEVMRYWRKIWDRVGYLVVDEGQRCPAKVFTHLVPNFDARYMLGLSNTSQRKDRLSRLVYYYLGDVVYTINEKDAREGRGIIHAHIVAKETGFEFPYHSRTDYETMLEALSRDGNRTSLILNDIETEMKEHQGAVLVLSAGAAQNEVLAAGLKERGIETLVYREEEKEEAGDEDHEAAGESPSPSVDLDTLRQPLAVLLTPRALTECSKKLKTNVLFLALPVYFKKNLAAAIRDLHTNGAGPAESRLKIYDYVDQRIGLLENYFRMRSYSYGVHPDSLLQQGMPRDEA